MGNTIHNKTQQKCFVGILLNLIEVSSLSLLIKRSLFCEERDKTIVRLLLMLLPCDAEAQIANRRNEVDVNTNILAVPISSVNKID